MTERLILPATVASYDLYRPTASVTYNRLTAFHARMKSGTFAVT